MIVTVVEKVTIIYKVFLCPVFIISFNFPAVLWARYSIEEEPGIELAHNHHQSLFVFNFNMNIPPPQRENKGSQTPKFI